MLSKRLGAIHRTRHRARGPRSAVIAKHSRSKPRAQNVSGKPQCPAIKPTAPRTAHPSASPSAMPPRRRKFSLAAALFDFPAPDGHSTPHQHAPDSWLELFTSKHADGEVFLGLFRSCRAGQDLVLRRAPQAKARLDCTASQSLAGWMRQLTAVWACLRTRGTHTRLAQAGLTVIRTDKAKSDVKVTMLLSSLYQAGAGQDIQALSLQTPNDPSGDHHLVRSEFLEAVALALPNLNSLTVNHCGARLPPPSNLPHLTHIDIDTDSGAIIKVCRSIAPYLRQIQSLHISCEPDFYAGDYILDSQVDIPMRWQMLFQPQQVSHTLTTLSTNAPLTNELVQLIIDHAPALRDLTVGGEEMALEQDWAGQGKEWGVQRLCLGFGQGEPTEVQAESLALLPKTRQGPLLVEGVSLRVMFTVTGQEASLLRLADRMPSWQLNVHTIDLCWKPSDADNLPDQAEAQCRMLRMLGLLAQPSNGTVVLSNWEYTFEALTVLAEALPGLGELSFTVRVGEPLTDELLGVVLGMGSRVQTLTCPSLALQSGQHANTPWPWEELRCTTLDVGQVCRLPDPAGTERGRGVVVDELVIGTSIDKVGTATRLSSIEFKPALPSNPPSIRITLQGSETHPPTKQSQILKHISLVLLDPLEVTVVLMGWNMTKEAYKALEGLPSWQGATLDMSQCSSWPLKTVRKIADTLLNVPMSFTCWRFPDTQLHRKVQGLIEEGLQGTPRRNLCVSLH